jgi:hypothetical protein
MLPEDWKKEIDQTISEAKSAYEDAQNRSAEQNREVAASVQILASQLERYNTAQDRDGPSKSRRENLTIGGLFATAAFTLALAGFSLWQVIETRRAYDPIKESADAARDAADAAKKQVEVATDVEKRQLRAYIGVIPPTDNQIVNRFIPPEKPLVHLTPRNFGLTPAYNALIRNGMGVQSYPLPKNFDYPIQGGTFLPNKITIYPGTFDIAGIVLDAQQPLTDQQIAAIQDGLHYRLYAWGTITYDDAFSDGHFTNFCISFYGLSAQQVRREPCQEHNDSN